jgi:predicted phage terminase large subunit-like protein
MKAASLVDDIELDAMLYKQSFREFIPEAFTFVEPNVTFVGNWHIDAIADHLQAVAEGHINRLVINVPPGTMKSLLTCVLWPAWIWTREEWFRFIFSSYSEQFTKRDSRKMRNLVTSQWYKQRFPNVRIARASRRDGEMQVSDSVLEWGTTGGGLRVGAATSSGVTGKHVNGICEDDPMKQQDAHSKAARETAWDYHKGTLSSRILPGERNWRVVTMQRLHIDDPTGRILKEGGWELLKIPMHYSKKRMVLTSLGRFDPRTEDGELLWPERMTEKYVQLRDKDLGPHEAAAQEEQEPSAVEGGIIKRSYLRKRWNKHTLPSEFMIEWMSADLALTDTGDPVGIQRWGYLDGNFYLIDWLKGQQRLGFTKGYQALLALASKSKNALTMPKVIENKANGPAMIELNAQLRTKVPGFEPFNPKGDKVVRLNSVSSLFASECVILPDESEHPEIEDLIENLCAFPNVAHDDDVDAISQALLFFQLRFESLTAISWGDAGMGSGEMRDPSIDVLR